MENKNYINYLELLAVTIVLTPFAKFTLNDHIPLKMDCRTAIFLNGKNSLQQPGDAPEVMLELNSSSRGSPRNKQLLQGIQDFPFNRRMLIAPNYF